MIVKINIFYNMDYYIFKNLIKELKSKKVNTIKKDSFCITLELDVSSFDEIIYILEKYNSIIEITLSIWSINEVTVYVTSKEPIDLGNQVT